MGSLSWGIKTYPTGEKNGEEICFEMVSSPSNCSMMGVLLSGQSRSKILMVEPLAAFKNPKDSRSIMDWDYLTIFVLVVNITRFVSSDFEIHGRMIRGLAVSTILLLTTGSLSRYTQRSAKIEGGKNGF